MEKVTSKTHPPDMANAFLGADWTGLLSEGASLGEWKGVLLIRVLLLRIVWRPLGGKVGPCCRRSI